MRPALRSIVVGSVMATWAMTRSAPAQSQAGSSQGWVVTETSLGPVGERGVASPDWRRVARVVRRPGQQRVLVDRADEGSPYQAIRPPPPHGSLLFSPDGRRLAYLAKRDGKWRMVVDGREVAEPKVGGFWVEHQPDFRFSLDGSRWFVQTTQGDSQEYWLLAEGASRSESREPVALAREGLECVSPDGRRFATRRSSGSPGLMSRAFPVNLAVHGPGGQESYPSFEVALWDWNLYDCGFTGETSCEFSPDGARLVHLARDRDSGRCELVLDGKPLGVNGSFWVPVFSPDSKRLAFAVKGPAGWAVIVDGEQLGVYEALGNGWDELGRERRLFFSSDGKRLAFAARVRGRWHVVVDGQVGEPYDEVGRPVFTRDAKSLAHRARTGQQWVVVTDGVAGKPYEKIEEAAISDGGSVREELLWSPDGRRLAYRARSGGKGLVVVGGQEGPPFEELGSPAFSTDGRHVAYAARRAGKWRLVIDGVEGAPHDFVSASITGGLGLLARTLTDRRVVFDGSGRLRTLIRRGAEYALLEVEVP